MDKVKEYKERVLQDLGAKTNWGIVQITASLENIYVQMLEEELFRVDQNPT